jgi:diguanylate cyclase (GGDEF)-like protein/PAS domain S-box-containing protein
MTDIHGWSVHSRESDCPAEAIDPAEAVDPAIAVLPAYCLGELLDAATECVLILGSDERINYLNGTAERELRQAAPLLGRTLWEVFPDARGTDFEAQIQRAMRERTQVAFEVYYKRLDGWFEIRIAPLASGGLGIWFSNINPRRARDEALRIVEERYRLAARATNDLLWDWDLLTNEVRWNEALEERFGYAVEALGTDSDWWLSRVHPDDRCKVELELKKCLVGRADRFVADYRFLRADGTYADIYDRGFVIRGPDGSALRFVGAMQDNSERKRNLADIAREKAHLDTIFGQALVGILHQRVNGELLMVNNRLCEILGRSEEQIRAGSMADFTHPDDLVWNQPLIENGLATGKPFQIEKRYLRPDGSIVWCDVSVSFVRGAGGEVESCIVAVQETTARKTAEIALASQSRLLQNVIDSVSDLIFVKDRSGRFILTNRALDEGCGKLVGLRTGEVKGLAEDYESLDREVMAAGEERRIEEMIPIRGTPRRFQTVKAPWRENDEIAGVIGVSRDITESKAAEEALRESELLYRSVLEGSPDFIVVMTPDGAIELINSAGLRDAASSLEELKGLEWASRWPKRAHKAVRAAVRQARAGSPARVMASYVSPTGATVWCDILVSPICDEGGNVVRLLAVTRDITQQRHTADKLKWASEHDSLTGLPNRRAFQARLQAATLRAMETGKKVGLLLMDLDRFKHINDTLGHSAGDHLLSSVGKRLKKSVRPGDFVSRLGGDEFAVIINDVENEQALVDAGNSILARLQGPVRLEGRLLAAGASIGGALFPTDAESAHELFNNADTALYAMKESGRGGTKMFHQHMREQAHKSANQLALARVAITERSVIPHYQQKVDLKTREIVGFEALLRWEHPRSGAQLPDTVAEAFKDYELASRFGELMQRGVLADIRKWMDRGLPVGTIAINAAPCEFLRDDYAERLLERVEEFGVPPHLLQVEVTEQVFLDRGSDFVGRALKVLNAAGLQVALDDFGTGYSSLSHLRDYPVDVVKIDQSFIRKMIEEPDIAAIVSAVMSLARSLRISVVAEGIETEAQLAMLQAKRCAVGQGYLFGRAVGGDEVPHFLDAAGKRARKALRNAA